MRRRPGTILALAGVAAAVAAPATAAGTLRKKVTVNDNYYLPAKLTVRKNTTIRWVWPADAGDVHDVKLSKGPAKARGFWSDPGAAGYTFSRKLTIPGTYQIVCTLHEEMTMRIKVTS